MSKKNNLVNLFENFCNEKKYEINKNQIEIINLLMIFCIPKIYSVYFIKKNKIIVFT